MITLLCFLYELDQRVITQPVLFSQLFSRVSAVIVASSASSLCIVRQEDKCDCYGQHHY